MPGIATGEVYSFAEGKLHLFASASGTTTGSGIGFARESTLTFTYGWRDVEGADRRYRRVMTGRRVEMSVRALYADRVLFNLANASAAVNARFEGLVTGAGLGKSAHFAMYSGVIDSVSVNQSDGAMNQITLNYHANDWSAFGQ